MLGVLIAKVFASRGSESGNLQKGPGITVTAIADTSLIVEIPLTAPRYACGTGRRLTHDKYLGFDTKQVSVSDTESVFLSDDSLNQIGYIYRPGETVVKNEGTDDSSSSIFQSSDSPFGWLGDLFEILFAIILVALALWFLWWLFNQRPSNQLSHPVATAPAPVPVTPVSATSPAPPAPPASPSPNEIVSHLKDLMTTMQLTGTTDLDYTTNGHELHLKNSGKKAVSKEKVAAPSSSNEEQKTEEEKN